MSEGIEEIRSSSDLSTILASALSNPELLSKMGEMLSRATQSTIGNDSPPNKEISENAERHTGNLSNDIANSEEPSPTFQNSINPDITKLLPEILSLLSSQKAEISTENKQQTALLLAIRPYLSERRRELIDSFIRFDRISSALRKLT